MATYNITEVRLLSVPLENDYKHTFHFNNLEAQTEYFLGRTKWFGSNFSYQRKDNYIAYPRHFDSLRGVNYVMYKNKAYGDKWFYAFITDMKYINDERTDIYIQTDVIQTWLFDYTIKPSFVEREHVDNDTVGLHTVPEQLETGDYVILAKNKNASLNYHSLIMAVTVDLNSEGFANASGEYYNGVYSGLKYYKVTGEEANKAIKALADAGKSDAIVAIFICPSLYIDSAYPEDNPNGYAEVKANLNVVRKDWNPSILGVEEEENYKVKALNGYVPKNKKLLTYPYTYLLMSNNSGGSAIYKYELFNNPDNADLCAFYIYASLTPGMSVYISPRYYNGVDINSLEGLTLGKYPTCAWNTDVYTNWLTQNAVNIPISIASAVVNAGVGAIGSIGTMGLTPLGVMGATGSVIGGVQSVLSTVGEIYQHSLIPPQAEGNINSGDVMFSSGCLTFTAYQMSIKKEYAMIIDEYFTMYGYKVNRVKVPSVGHRENFWYTKTIDVNIDGAIPNDDMQKIKDCYNRGITFWYNPSYIGNYNVSNEICG